MHSARRPWSRTWRASKAASAKAPATSISPPERQSAAEVTFVGVRFWQDVEPKMRTQFGRNPILGRCLILKGKLPITQSGRKLRKVSCLVVSMVPCNRPFDQAPNAGSLWLNDIPLKETIPMVDRGSIPQSLLSTSKFWQVGRGTKNRNLKSEAFVFLRFRHLLEGHPLGFGRCSLVLVRPTKFVEKGGPSWRLINGACGPEGLICNRLL